MSYSKRNTRQRGGITSKAVEAWRIAKQSRPDSAAYETAWDTLHAELALRPWDTHPLDVQPGESCPYPPGTAGHESWQPALDLRAELEAACHE